MAETLSPACTDNDDLTREQHILLFTEMGGCPYCGLDCYCDDGRWNPDDEPDDQCPVCKCDHVFICPSHENRR